jgi:hypothetical protein
LIRWASLIIRLRGTGSLIRAIGLRAFGDGDRDWIAGWEGLLDGMVEPRIEVHLRVLSQIVVREALRRLTLLPVRRGLTASMGAFTMEILQDVQSRFVANLHYWQCQGYELRS